MANEFDDLSIRDHRRAWLHEQSRKLLKVSHSSCTKVIELCLEIVDSIPKPLQRIWVHWHPKGTLGFRLWSHHYPSLFLLSFCSSFSCLPEVVECEIRPFQKNL
jgi:hypothetical protein